MSIPNLFAAESAARALAEEKGLKLSSNPPVVNDLQELLLYDLEADGSIGIGMIAVDDSGAWLVGSSLSSAEYVGALWPLDDGDDAPEPAPPVLPPELQAKIEAAECRLRAEMGMSEEPEPTGGDRLDDAPLLLDQLAREQRIAADWVDALRAADPKIDAKLAACYNKVEHSGECLPQSDAIWRAYELPLGEVRVLILGQDPYPNDAHAVGLSFSTGPGGPIPDSLRNIYSEMKACGFTPREDGDISAWTQRGVMLLNRALTIPVDRAARPKRHLGWWKPLVVATAKALATEASGRPVAAMLWGVPAQSLRRHLEPNVKVFASSHPSPLSASRPTRGSDAFIGSGHFTKVDEWFEENGEPPVGWGPRISSCNVTAADSASSVRSMSEES